MRRSLAGVALAVTAMVALSFLIPLGFLVASQARAQHRTQAEQRAAALAPVLTLDVGANDLRQVISDLDDGDRLGVQLPDGQVIGAHHAPATLLTRAKDNGEALAQDVQGGWLYLQPVILAQGRVAVVESFVPQAELSHGITRSWAIMALLALGLVAGSTALADRLAARVVRSSTTLSHASHALGAGDLTVRVEPMGPPELQEAGRAFNSMAARMVDLLATERELVADLSHRLRTPLTALHLAVERMGANPQSKRVDIAIAHLESELDSIIRAARTPLSTRPMGTALRAPEDNALRTHTDELQTCELGGVVERRAAFWAVLAEQEERRCEIVLTTESTPVALPADDVTAVLDALVGNIFRHTAPGCALAVGVERTAQTAVLVVEDAGPGIADPAKALSRGSSSSSTGLGLDIARRAAIATGGELDVGRSRLGGARIEVRLPLFAPPTNGVRGRIRRRRPAPCCRALGRRKALRRSRVPGS